MSEDWKGEHFIRGRKLPSAERRGEDSSIKATLAHAKRRAAGIPLPAKDQHDKLLSSVMIDLLSGQWSEPK